MKQPPTYTLSADGRAMTCHLCGFTSFHPMDVAERYCGHCRMFLGDLDWSVELAVELGMIRPGPSDRLHFLRRVIEKLRGLSSPTPSG